MLTIEGRRYDTGEPVRITTRGDRIADIQPAWPTGPAADWPWVAPALFDLQINGYGGVWFSDDSLTPEMVLKTLQPYYRFGVTRICPTLITNSQAALEAGFRAIRTACEQSDWAAQMVPGCHLEGPYISPEDGARGAHPLEHVRAADWDEFERLQAAAGGLIRLVTLAPEIPGAIEFIRKAVAAGVVISLGHTAATPEQIRAGIDAGATLGTHLGNGCAAMIHRHRNHFWEQLADDRLTVSLITDGHHLPANLVKAIVRAKTTRRVVITCDAAGWAGCPPGIYESKLGKSEILPNGKLVVAGQRELLAGSSFETDVCVARMIDYAGVSLKDAIDMASRNPARLLGFPTVRLRPGDPAELMVFHYQPGDVRLAVQAAVGGGALRFGEIGKNA
jgi:N-acetylglucosamine-6-phosphate deacetylase